MTRAAIAGWAFGAALVLLALAAGYRGFVQDDDPAPAALPSVPPPDAASPAPAPPDEAHRGVLYGRVTTVVGAVYEGRLRFGGDQEAFWGDYFNGFKAENPWAVHVPPDRLPTVDDPIEVFGFTIVRRRRPIDLGRPFMARFGDVARIEALGVGGVRVTLKGGTAFDLDRFEAGDFDDGVRVWAGSRGVVDLDTRLIRGIEFLPAPSLDDLPARLHGTVRTRSGEEFTGFVQWDRQACVGSDELEVEAGGEPLRVRFDAVRSIARYPDESPRVTLLDGREVDLPGTRGVGGGNRGIHVDDRRYGRVLVSWAAFERLDFSPGGSGPGYDDFPPGRPLAGRVTTRTGRRAAGRLVFDLDESETTETLDAPWQGVDYTIPLGLIASIVLPGPAAGAAEDARVTLRDGQELRLERAGDLGAGNAGLLVFFYGDERPEYVPWSDVERIDFGPA